MCVTLAMQLRILFIARKHERQIAEEHQRYGPPATESNNWARRNKAQKTVVALLIIHLICWLPMLCTAPLIHNHTWRVFNWLNFLIAFNAAMNPCLFIMMTQTFRASLFKFIMQKN